MFAGGGDSAMHALDAATGAEVWHAALARRVNGTPMTYARAAAAVHRRRDRRR